MASHQLQFEITVLFFFFNAELQDADLQDADLQEAIKRSLEEM